MQIYGTFLTYANNWRFYLLQSSLPPNIVPITLAVIPMNAIIAKSIYTPFFIKFQLFIWCLAANNGICNSSTINHNNLLLS